MLHLVTPLFRYELLDEVYRSVPPHDDIVWHIVKTSRRAPLDHLFITTDPRIRLYEIDCDDTDIVTKRNIVFDAVTDGYFYLLDDDTICLEEMYRVYREYSAAGFVGMIVGDTNMNRGRLPSLDPARNRIDAGAVICHHAVLRHVRWAWSPGIARDNYFWSQCFAYFGPSGTAVVRRRIALYNHLGPLLRVRKQVLGVPIRWDIRSPLLARCYILAAAARRRLPAWLPGHR